MYVEAEVDDRMLWLAAPETEMAEGQQLTWFGGTQMGEFRSSSLERTFDDILFVERIWVER